MTTHLNQHMVKAIGSDFRHLPTSEMPAGLAPLAMVLSSESLRRPVSLIVAAPSPLVLGLYPLPPTVGDRHSLPSSDASRPQV